MAAAAAAKAEMASHRVGLFPVAEAAEQPPVSSSQDVSTAASELPDGDQKTEVAAAAGMDDTGLYGPVEFRTVAAAEQRLVSSDQVVSTPATAAQSSRLHWKLPDGD
ncbi:hypothetical protein PR202_gb07167 [Eleusine coracana subsp. coracana]|uniref:Uncharacterized protein n=1 Tax=Eleusine coracana subsp. coracana TaxID=191504 RepID=A0AAV5E9Q8_ELECO|nr:hypothetical protein PR202_gb07167 [Eleusine coracana subsp. coracana]